MSESPSLKRASDASNPKFLALQETLQSWPGCKPEIAGHSKVMQRQLTAEDI
jgi:hypothetical protein